MARYPNWLRKIMFVFAMSVFGLLGTQCGTFEINGQLVTATPTGSTVTFTPSAIPSTSTPTPMLSATAKPSVTGTPTLRAIDNAQPTNGATAGLISNQLGVPQLADSQIIVDINSHLIYRSQTNLTAARIFYGAEMQATGWKLAKDEHSNTHALLTFTKANETVTVALKTDSLGLLLDIKR